MGRDTIPLETWLFTPSTDSLDVAGPTPLRLTPRAGPVEVELTYTFAPDDYRIEVQGRVTGVGPNGGHAARRTWGRRWPTPRPISTRTTARSALVTQPNDAERTDLAGLKPGEPKTVSGPLDWAAIKSKYFVTGVLAYDSTGGRHQRRRHPRPADHREAPHRGRRPAEPAAPAERGVRLHRLCGTDGVRPAEPARPRVRRRQPVRLARASAPSSGRWPVGVRWLLVWMHEHLHLAYGLVLVFFGIMVRVLLWPLNQKAMRANMQLQAVQPLMKDIQERYKNDPQKLQQEMFKLYKEYNVNPLGGCWPMLLPMPVLFALFFVFQNTIELRGASFLWLPDLSRPDPLYIIPVIMGLSMYGLSKVGQIGMEPNPQMKMMLYIMPVMMTFLFLNFASGLNLYYAVSNIASIPQQWMLARERVRSAARRAIVEVKKPSAGSRAKREGRAPSGRPLDRPASLVPHALRPHRRARHAARAARRSPWSG